MNRIVLGVVFAAIAFAAFARETIRLGNLQITCPNQCVQVRNGDNVTVTDSRGAQLEIILLDQQGPVDP